MFDITPIIQLVAIIVAGLVTTYLIPWIKSKTTAEQREEIQKWVNISVSAAEMIYAGSGMGAEKKAYVLALLNEKGFTVDETELDTLIEAAVYQLKNGVVAKY